MARTPIRKLSRQMRLLIYGCVVGLGWYLTAIYQQREREPLTEALLIAVDQNNYEAAKSLLDRGADVNGDGPSWLDSLRGWFEDRGEEYYPCWESPLLTAISNENIPMVKLLLAYGANVDVRKDFCADTSNLPFQGTARELAKRTGDKEILLLLQRCRSRESQGCKLLRGLAGIGKIG
jgi:hypothetical protein